MVTDGAANRQALTYSPQQERRLASAHLMPGPAAEPFSGRSGRRVNNSGLKVTVDSAGNGTFTVSPGPGTIFSSTYANEGVWEFEIDNQVGPVSFGARPGSGTSRIDRIIARIYDTDALGTGPREVKIERVSSSTVATPTAPVVPPLSLLLATCTVGSAGVITVVPNTQVSVAAGGILPVATIAERDALKTDGIAYEGMYVDVASTNGLDRYDGTNWVPVRSGIVRKYMRADAAASRTDNTALPPMTLPEIPVASRAMLDLVGHVGFVATANVTTTLTFAVSAGTLVDPFGGLRDNVPTSATWASFVRRAWVDIPANTPVTVTTKFYTDMPTGGWWAGVQTAEILLAGEY